MPASHEFARPASLLVLAFALVYSAYAYFSGDFENLGFILRLTRNPMVYAWPVLRVIFGFQVLIAIAALGAWIRPRLLRWLSLSSITLAVLTQTVVLASCISLEFDSRVTHSWFILPIVGFQALALFGCLIFALRATKPRSQGVSPSGGSEK